MVGTERSAWRTGCRKVELIDTAGDNLRQKLRCHANSPEMTSTIPYAFFSAASVVRSRALVKVAGRELRHSKITLKEKIEKGLDKTWVS